MGEAKRRKLIGEYPDKSETIHPERKMTKKDIIQALSEKSPFLSIPFTVGDYEGSFIKEI